LRTRFADWTFEERLHRLRNRFLLLSDVFRLRVVNDDGLEADGDHEGPQVGIADLCEETAADMRGLLNALPVDILNWTESGQRRVSRRRASSRT
jgi:hypothetical protein